MTARRLLLTATVLSLLIVTLVAGCSSTNPASQATGTTPVIASSPTSSATSSAPATSMPKQVSDFPEGIYRTQLTIDDLLRDGVTDLTNAGIWTLTIKAGTYQLDCRVISDPQSDCGDSQPSGTKTVEFGEVRGAAPTIWFVHNMARLSQMTGCDPHSQGSNGCGADGGYHIDWQTMPDGIAFSNFVGLGDEAGFLTPNVWTAQPWTRIS